MDINIKAAFEEALKAEFQEAIISNSSNKEKCSKVKIRPIIVKDELLYQATEYVGEKVLHTNYSREALLGHLPNWLENLLYQCELKTKSGQINILISKKGKATIKKKGSIQPVDKGSGIEMEQLQHNKKKNYILEEGKPLPFLIDLGVMNQTGQLVKSRSDKFRQINRFLEFIEDIVPYLDQDRELTILDFGCGKSYLTFALYYYLRIMKGYQINVIGLDLKKDVIQKCNELSVKYGYDHMKFLHGDIASYDGKNAVDMVVTLHACDTATDHALYKAVTWGAQVILSVPCCQHELNQQMKNDTLKPIFEYGIVKERMAALITDSLRGEILKTKGYRVQLLEFIDMENTPKNILIRAVKKKGTTSNGTSKDLESCVDFFGVDPCLLRLFKEEKQEE